MKQCFVKVLFLYFCIVFRFFSMDLVAKYVEQVLKILREKQAVSEQIAQLDKLSETLGLTAHDLAYLEKQFEDGLKRGEGYLRYKQWDKATEELEQAVLLKPLHTEAIYKTALAYSQKYAESRREEDRQKALDYAERCLQTDAEKDEALALVGKLRSKWVLWKSWAYRHAIWIAIGSITLLIALIVWFLIPSEREILEKEQLYAQKQNIPIELDKKMTDLGVKLDIEASFARIETGGLAYHLRAHLYSKVAEISQLELALELYDGAGKLLKTQDLKLIEEQHFEARPADYVPIAMLLQIPEMRLYVGKARLVTKKIVHQHSPKTYEPAKIIALKNEEKIAKLGLEMQERYQTLKPAPDEFEHILCLAYRHHNSKPLRSWSIEIQWIDKQDRLIHTEIRKLITPDEPLLKAEKWRTQTAHFSIPIKHKDFSRYQILVLQVE